MVPGERSPAADGPALHRLSRLRLPRAVPAANKRSVLGLLALLLGGASAPTADGFLVGIPLLVAGWWLAVAPLLGTTCTR